MCISNNPRILPQVNYLRKGQSCSQIIMGSLQDKSMISCYSIFVHIRLFIYQQFTNHNIDLYDFDIFLSLYIFL